MMSLRPSPCRLLDRPVSFPVAGRGFTLIEMMTVVAIMGILLAIAVPSFTLYFEKYRAKRAAETISAFLVNAKSEAAKRNEKVYADFSITAGGTPWYIGLTTVSTGCDPTTAGSCQIGGVDRVVSSTEFTGVLLTNPDDGDIFSFNPQRGTTTSDNVEITSAGGKKIQVNLSGRGRIKLCSPSPDGMGGYSAC